MKKQTGLTPRCWSETRRFSGRLCLPKTSRTFLKNHASEIAAIDFFVVPTANFGIGLVVFLFTLAALIPAFLGMLAGGALAAVDIVVTVSSLRHQTYRTRTPSR